MRWNVGRLGLCLIGLLSYSSLNFAQAGNSSYEKKLSRLDEALDKRWQLVKEFPQKCFPKTVPPGNYSGITHLYNDVYAVVSDKSDSALYYNFRIQINPETGELLDVTNLGYRIMVDGSVYDGNLWMGTERGFDHEAIAKVSDSTLVVASEGKFRIKEYSVTPSFGDLKSAKASKWEKSWNPSDFAPNYAFESLAYDSVRHCIWTIPESVLARDGVPATPQNPQANNLRLMQINSDGQVRSYAYQMDKPSAHRQADTYVMGVSEMSVLPDGQLLVLEREAFVPKIKIGAFCKCKLYCINPDSEEQYPMQATLGTSTPFVKKHLLVEWKTGLSVFDRSFANYEGMCVGPQLKNGAWVIILLSDSQNQYVGVLKDWFKIMVIH